MSKQWPDKTIIGLTGNIASGKSIVRRMLEHHGAFSIDADSLSHRAMSPGAPAYKPIIKTFGQFVLNENGRIDRTRLGTIVFNDPDALSELERIIHPIVFQVLKLLIKRSKQKVVVIEAIKLLETEIKDYCDLIWVVDASEDTRVERLIKNREMSQKEAILRVAAQTPASEKIRSADVLINNNGDFESTYKQVLTAINKITGAPVKEPVIEKEIDPGTIRIIKGGPKQAADMADFLKEKLGEPLTRNDILMRFGQKAYQLAYSGNDIVGLAGWQVENLITRITEIYMDSGLPIDNVMGETLDSIEAASLALQSELSLLFIKEELVEAFTKVLKIHDYEKTQVSEIKVPDWRDAIEESQPDNSVIFSKKLRDRIFKPM